MGLGIFIAYILAVSTIANHEFYVHRRNRLDLRRHVDVAYGKIRDRRHHDFFAVLRVTPIDHSILDRYPTAQTQASNCAKRPNKTR